MAEKLLLSGRPFNCKCGNDLFEEIEEAQFVCSICRTRYLQKNGTLVDKSR